jgi:hypothetical protein
MTLFFMRNSFSMVLRNTMGQKMQLIKSGFIVFATDDSRAGIDAARVWLKLKALSQDQVRLYRDNGQVLVETLKPIAIAPS